MPDSPNQPPPRVWLIGQVAFRHSRNGGIPYVPKTEVDAVVESFRRRAVEAAKKLQIGGLSRTHVYTMLQNLPAEQTNEPNS